MIEARFGLKHRPFHKSISTGELYCWPGLEELDRRLEMAKRARGIMLLTGEPGTGKTVSLRRFVDTLNSEHYRSVYLPLANVTVLDAYARRPTRHRQSRPRRHVLGRFQKPGHRRTRRCHRRLQGDRLMLPQFDLDDLAEAVTEFVTEDLDYLYGQRMLNHRAQAQGPEGDATRAANSIAYLASRLLPEILRYQRGLIRLRQQQSCCAVTTTKTAPGRAVQPAPRTSWAGRLYDLPAQVVPTNSEIRVLHTPQSATTNQNADFCYSTPYDVIRSSALNTERRLTWLVTPHQYKPPYLKFSARVH